METSSSSSFEEHHEPDRAANRASPANRPEPEQLYLSTDDSPAARRSREFWAMSVAITRRYWELLSERGGQ